MSKSVLIKKYSGEYEAFDINKLINSLRRSNAHEDLVQEIALKVQDELEEGMTTKKIYRIAFRMLKSKSRVSASKYKLKKALMEMGPTGFPFEILIGKLLAHEGFSTQVGVMVQGDCVQHEIDVIAQKNNKHYMIECKFPIGIAFRMLKSKSRVSASKYKLKKALMEMGPTGFPFEILIGKLLAHEGFSTQVGVMVQGDCVQHEIDVIAQKNNKHYMIECKFHGHQGRFCDVKTPLYIQSRFVDVEKQWERQKGHGSKLHKGGLYTNTRFTSVAIQYGNCVGLLLTSWDYPRGNGLKDRIDKSGLHPLTALTTLTKAEKTKLLDKGIVLCKELYENPALLEQIGVSKKRHEWVLEDSEELCKSI